MSTSHSTSIDEIFVNSIKDEIVSFMVYLEPPSTREDKNHLYDLHIALSFGTSEHYFIHGASCHLALKKIKLHIVGDLLNDRVITICDKINLKYKYSTQISSGSSQTTTSTKKENKLVKAISFAEVGLGSENEYSDRIEKETSTTTNIEKGIFEVHCSSRGRQIWSLKAPAGERLTSKAKQKYSEAKSKKLDFWISIGTDYWYFGEQIKALPPTKRHLVQYILHKKYRNEIKRSTKTKQAIEAYLTKNPDLVIYPLEVRINDG